MSIIIYNNLERTCNSVLFYLNGKKGGGKLAKLTLKQQRFADEYIISGNATEAYKKAGYSVASDNIASVEGQKLLRNPKVKTYLDKKLSELSSNKIAEQQEVLEFLTSIMRGEETEQILRNVGDFTQEITDIKISAKDRIKAADILNKVYQAREDKKVANADRIIIVDSWRSEEDG